MLLMRAFSILSFDRRIVILVLGRGRVRLPSMFTRVAILTEIKECIEYRHKTNIVLNTVPCSVV
jgi:hypothetical protein